MIYKRFTKYYLDILISSILLIIFSPIIIALSAILMIVNKGKIFFIQKRPGKNEQIFNLIKFKTMSDKCDNNGNLLPDKDRLTILGYIIRKTSVDELPQLINVIKGDMSIVGPRPLLIEYLPKYNKDQKRRHEVKPGITGWAQINGRNAVSWQERFNYDLYYVEHISFFFDLKIILLTIIKVLKTEGIQSNNSVTMEKFEGKS